MGRNACINHPRDKVIEIPEGYRYCKRCRHLVPPEAELPEEIKTVEESAVDGLHGILNKIIDEHNAPDKVELEAELPDSEHERIHDSMQITETPLEAEPEEKEQLQEEPPEETAPVEESEPIAEEVVAELLNAEAEAVKEPLEAIPPDTVEEAKRRVKISRLKAKLAELTKDE